MTEVSTFSVPHRDYFISRSTVDAAFAGWIGKRPQGKTYVDQSEHFGHEDIMNAVHKAFLSGARVVALYSQSYLDSKYCVREATEALKGDPANEQQRLIPLRIEPCAPAGMLNVTYTDLPAERRQADASALAICICRALGLAPPDLSRLPPLPEGLLVSPPRLIHPQIRISRGDLAPRPEIAAFLRGGIDAAGILDVSANRWWLGPGIEIILEAAQGRERSSPPEYRPEPTALHEPPMRRVEVADL
jgi:hypothetical protein